VSPLLREGNQAKRRFVSPLLREGNQAKRRFVSPLLREGNQAVRPRGSPAGRGNLKEGVNHAPCLCAACPVRCYIVRHTNWIMGRAYELPPSFRSDKGTSLEFTVCGARTLFRPHPQPLSHAVGEGCRAHGGAFPPLPPAGEGDKGGEGNTARLPVHATAGKNRAYPQDSVPNRCTLTSSFRFPSRSEGNRWLGRVPSLREGNQAMRPFGSPCGQGEP
jgi:hypothetical protein